MLQKDITFAKQAPRLTPQRRGGKQSHNKLAISISSLKLIDHLSRESECQLIRKRATPASGRLFLPWYDIWM